MSVETPSAATEALQNVGPVLKDRVVIIVGASRGIGAGIARGVARAGATMVLASRDMDATNAVADEIAAYAERPSVLSIDVANPVSIRSCMDAVVDRHGRLDGAVNNAGRSHPGALLADLDDDYYEMVFDPDVRGMFQCMKAQIGHMLRTGGGSIVNLASIGSNRALATKALYIAAKHADAGLTRGAAVDYATHNIRINAIAPGSTFTEMVAQGLGSTEEGRKGLVANVPMARFATTDEMAGTAIWLLSGLSSYVTGAIVPVDGGWAAA